MAVAKVSKLEAVTDRGLTAELQANCPGPLLASILSLLTSHSHSKAKKCLDLGVPDQRIAVLTKELAWQLEVSGYITNNINHLR